MWGAGNFAGGGGNTNIQQVEAFWFQDLAGAGAQAGPEISCQLNNAGLGGRDVFVHVHMNAGKNAVSGVVRAMRFDQPGLGDDRDPVVISTSLPRAFSLARSRFLILKLFR